VDSRLEAQRLENRGSEGSQERRPVARARYAAARHRIRWHWVKGHNDHPLNDRADALANRGVFAAVQAPSQSDR